MATSTGLLVLTELAGNPPAYLNTFQTFLTAHAQFITFGWIAIWCVTGLCVLWVGFIRKQD